MQFIENNKIEMKETLDYIGVPTFIMTLLLNITRLVTDWNINAWLIVITSFFGVLYIIYKILNARKESKLLNLKIEKEQLEIDKLKK